LTFSIVARCEETGMFGVSVCSSSPAVGARCGFARAGVGAVASQNITDPELGDALIASMAAGAGAPLALADLTAAQPYIAWRQLIAVDANGETATFSGAKTLGVHATAKARNVAAAGNLLASRETPDAMVAAFLASAGPLGERLIGAMQAGVASGGEAGPVHSIGLKIVDKLSWPVVDLRVDWTEESPVARLQALWDVFAPLAADYVTRALDPESAPGFGVAGDSAR
jgi:uncharacterized Ntn-hydrolase superfamily protein